MTTGEKIKEARLKLGYTQERLAEELIVSRQAIAKWESNRGVPDIENLKAIANFFNISVDDLINEETTLTQEQDLENTDSEENITKEDKRPDKLGTTKNIYIAIISALIAIVLLIVILVCTSVAKHNSKVKKAESFVNSGDFVAAAEIYDELDEDEKREECMYNYAKELYKKGDYTKAISEIGDISYKDSDDLLNAWKYEFALYNLKNENYEDALELFEELDEYNDSEAKYKEVSNYYGIKLYNQKKFKDAATYLQKGSDLYNKALYNEAVRLNNAGDYGIAYNRFLVLSEAGNEDAKDNAYKILKAFSRSSTWSYTNYSNNRKASLYVNLTNKGFYDIRYVVFESDGTIVSSSQYSAMVISDHLFCINSSLERIYIYFRFNNNNNAYIHVHNNDSESAECDALCQTYHADKVDLDSYTTKISYDFKKVKEPKLSFEKEISNLNKANQEQKDTSTSSKEKNVNTASEPSESKKTTNTTSKKTSTITTTTSKNIGTAATVPSEDTDTITSKKVNTAASTTTTSNTSIVNSDEKNTSTSNESLASQTTTNTTSNKKEPSSSSKATSVNPCANGHDWKELTKKVHHDEEGHYEQVEVSEEYKWYKCGLCSSKYNDIDEYYSHFDTKHTDSLQQLMREDYSQGTVPAEYEEKWVVDKKAYDEVVVTGYECKVCKKKK